MPRLLLLLLVLACAAPAIAQETPAVVQTSLEQPDHWSGEGSANGSYTTGNTTETDVGIDMKVKHTKGLWTQYGEFSGDYGDENDVETKLDLTATLAVDRILTKRWSVYLRGWWENNEFSGFGDRYFVGPGLRYKVFDEKKLIWTLEGGAGLKYDEVDATADAPARNVEAFGLRAASQFRYNFSTEVALTNDTVMLYSKEFTLYINTIAVTAALVGRLSARASFEIHYDANPPGGFEYLETTTKFSLVYKVP